MNLGLKVLDMILVPGGFKRHVERIIEKYPKGHRGIKMDENSQKFLRLFGKNTERYKKMLYILAPITYLLYRCS